MGGTGAAWARRIGWPRIGWVALAVAGLIWFLWTVRAIWPPIIAAFLIAVVLDPLVDRLEARRLPRGIAVGIIYAAFIGGLALLLWMGVPVIAAQLSEVSGSLSGLLPKGNTATLVKPTQDWLRHVHIPGFLRESALHQLLSLTRSTSAALNGIAT